VKNEALTVLVAFVLACKQDTSRCAHCGMKLDPQSPWSAEIDDGSSMSHFDTPRCALTKWLVSGKRGTVRVQDYYDRGLHPASDVRFVLGSDVVGPMGTDLVPVDVTRVAKFEKDHGGTRALAIDDIDIQAIQP